MKAIAIHGGAGTILKSKMSPEQEKEYSDALKEAVEKGFEVLEKNGHALDATEAAVVSLENCPLFNAGRGSVFTHEGRHEMDASVMDGKTLSAGAAAGVRHVKNPVLLARAIMEHSEHVLLAGEGAEQFAQKMKLPVEADAYFFSELRYGQLQEIRATEQTALDHDRKFGTVGAVAIDSKGNLAAATSTGGMTNKRYGRIGDTPLIGCGTYANNKTCAVSCTGHGEFFIRSVVAYDVSCLMEYKGLSIRNACEEVVMKKLKSLGGDGGLIAIDYAGNIELIFNCEGMYRAWKKEGEPAVTAIYR